MSSKKKRRIQHVDRREAKRAAKRGAFVPWALKQRPKGAKKATGKAETSLCARIVTNVELRRAGAWRIPTTEAEKKGTE